LGPDRIPNWVSRWRVSVIFSLAVINSEGDGRRVDSIIPPTLK
jgi:hypothetical protein